MHDSKPGRNTFNDISAIDARLAELDKEKQCLLAIKKALKKSQAKISASEPFSATQKISIFRSLFRGRTDIFATRWHNHQGRSGYSVACNNEWVRRCLQQTQGQMPGLQPQTTL